jgi:hypothetical protein
MGKVSEGDSKLNKLHEFERLEFVGESLWIKNDKIVHETYMVKLLFRLF